MLLRRLLFRPLTGLVSSKARSDATPRTAQVKVSAAVTSGNSSQVLSSGEDVRMWGLSSPVLDPTCQTSSPYTDSTASADWYDDVGGIWSGAGALSSGDVAAADWGWRGLDGDTPVRVRLPTTHTSSSTTTTTRMLSEAADDASGIWSGALEGTLVAACDASADWGWGPFTSVEADDHTSMPAPSYQLGRFSSNQPAASAAAVTNIQLPYCRDDLSGIFSGALDGALVAADDPSADWGWQESPELDALPPLTFALRPQEAPLGALPQPDTANVPSPQQPHGAVVAGTARAGVLVDEAADEEAGAASDTEDLPQEFRHVARAVKILATAGMDECLLDQFDALVAHGVLPSVMLSPTRFDADLDGLEPASVAAAVAILSNARACRALEDIIMETELPPPRPAAADPEPRRRRPASSALSAAQQAQRALLVRHCLSGCARMPESPWTQPGRGGGTFDEAAAEEGSMESAADEWGADEVRAVLDMDPATTRELASFLGALREGQSASAQREDVPWRSA